MPHCLPVASVSRVELVALLQLASTEWRIHLREAPHDLRVFQVDSVNLSLAMAEVECVQVVRFLFLVVGTVLVHVAELLNDTPVLLGYSATRRRLAE